MTKRLPRRVVAVGLLVLVVVHVHRVRCAASSSARRCGPELGSEVGRRPGADGGCGQLRAGRVGTYEREAHADGGGAALLLLLLLRGVCQLQRL